MYPEHGYSEHPVHRRVDGREANTLEHIAEEVPVALVFNGISYAVMLATPRDLEDFALGFSLSEGVIEHPSELYDLEVIEHEDGVEVQMRIAEARFTGIKEHRRAMAGRTGCGLCGIESLAQAVRRPAMVQGDVCLEAGALLRAQDQLFGAQPLFQLTGAVHAAAWCGLDGEVRIVHEDVGRHNALDKVIGGAIARKENLSAGFVFVTSRASYEMVSKAATVGILVLAAVSAPTALAVRVADECGLTLIGFARGSSHSVYSHPERVCF